MADMAKFLEQLQEFDVNDIDFNRVGVWPIPAKIFLCVLVSVALVAACYFVIIKDKKLALSAEVNKEQSLRADFERKAHEAANLDTYRAQMDKMEESFGALVARLPTDTEVPGLLEDIDDKGVESRLEINSISLQKEVASDIHVELPIKINVTGGYHEFGAFVSGIAGMPRIVTLHDFSITPTNKDGSGMLAMEMLAKTYRYKSEE
ncbi:type 4a pilus biogenesis protein PilO [Agaribacterium haliotis]|uniref:type 4a pilus biogenesis protein PilO n=1 Tax=Agaribacterium haliotis TaxID=2013869 RepID=UPI000BB559D8|nr:type 4a pilus biogenesis protein PilO [Agaribacterium haliotis]